MAEDTDRREEVGASSAAIRRPGYPVIEDPEHPLWGAQQDMWVDYTPWEAFRAAAEYQQQHRRRGNSTSHPAFSSSYIKNDQAEREGAVEKAQRVEPVTDRR